MRKKLDSSDVVVIDQQGEARPPSEPQQPEKALNIAQVEHGYKFSFIGNWIGKDIKEVSRFMRREYLRYKKSRLHAQLEQGE